MGFESPPGCNMRIKVTLGDMLTQEQLRALTKGMIAEQRTGSRTPRSRQSDNRLDGVCERIQWMRHKRQRGEWKNRSRRGTTEQAILRYESDWRYLCGTELEDTQAIFNVAKTVSSPYHKCNKPGMRNTCVRPKLERPRGIRKQPYAVYSSTSLTGVMVGGEY